MPHDSPPPKIGSCDIVEAVERIIEVHHRQLMTENSVELLLRELCDWKTSYVKDSTYLESLRRQLTRSMVDTAFISDASTAQKCSCAAVLMNHMIQVHNQKLMKAEAEENQKREAAEAARRQWEEYEAAEAARQEEERRKEERIQEELERRLREEEAARQAEAEAAAYEEQMRAEEERLRQAAEEASNDSGASSDEDEEEALDKRIQAALEAEQQRREAFVQHVHAMFGGYPDEVCAGLADLDATVNAEENTHTASHAADERSTADAIAQTTTAAEENEAMERKNAETLLAALAQELAELQEATEGKKAALREVERSSESSAELFSQLEETAKIRYVVMDTTMQKVRHKKSKLIELHKHIDAAIDEGVYQQEMQLYHDKALRGTQQKMDAMREKLELLKRHH